MIDLLKKICSKLNMDFYKTENFYINVPYSEKDIAKQLGAKWDPQKKSWFIPKEIDHAHFKKWIHKSNEENINLCSNGFFIANSWELCWRCRKTTQVFAFFLPEKHQVKNYNEDDEGVFWIT